MLKNLATLTGAALVALFLASPSSALTMKECSTKYNAAKDDGTLDGMKWNDFRKSECGSDDTADAPAKTATKKAAAKKATPASDDGDQAAGLTRKECSAKYQAAKAADALNGMKWNDFRKAECGPGATADVAAPKKAAKTAKTTDSADADQAAGLSMKECSAKYQSAKDADALDGMKWNDFRKAECGPGSTTAMAKPVKKSTAAAAADGKGLSMKECSAKYQNAKADGSLGGLKWNDFRKSACGANAADDDTVPSVDEATYTDEPETPVVKAPRGVSFPRAVARKFASETPGKQRMRTCLEQYYENKDSNTLAGLRWIQKGGGYYSLCNARLKAAGA